MPELKKPMARGFVFVILGIPGCQATRYPVRPCRLFIKYLPITLFFTFKVIQEVAQYWDFLFYILMALPISVNIKLFIIVIRVTSTYLLATTHTDRASNRGINPHILISIGNLEAAFQDTRSSQEVRDFREEIKVLMRLLTLSRYDSWILTRDLLFLKQHLYKKTILYGQKIQMVYSAKEINKKSCKIFYYHNTSNKYTELIRI